MPIEKDDFIRCLVQKLGFEPDGGTGHGRYVLRYPGGKVNTYLDRHQSKGRTIDDGVLGFIAKQMRLTLSELKRLCQCDLTRDWYLGVVATRTRLYL